MRPLSRPRAPGERVRILYLIDKLHRAGAQVHLGQLIKGLDREAFEPRVCCLLKGGPVAESLQQSGVPVEVLGLTNIYGPKAWHGLIRLVRLLRTQRIELIHTYLVSSNVYGTFAARLARVPIVVTTRRDTGFSRNWRLGLVEEWLVNPLVDRVVAVSPAVAEVATRERALANGRVVTIPNGVDVDRWDPARYQPSAIRRERGIEADEKIIGIVAGLSPVKGHADFLRAAKLVLDRYPRARFFIIGDGELRAQLEALGASLGLGDRAVFTGARGDVPELLSMLDVSVLSSATEGMSNTLLESMAMARPIIATAVGGNVDVLRAGLTGVLVPPRNPEALAEAMLRLLNDPEGAGTMGRAARRHVVEEFTLARMVSRYERFYQALLAGEPNPAKKPH
jgi:glycosyltransferase involved in cell wall biosynthesis